MQNSSQSSKSSWLVSDSGIQVPSANGTLHLAWLDLRGVFFPLFGNRPYIRTQNGQRYDLPEDNETLRSVLKPLFLTWQEKFPYLAKKNAFDYGESPKAGAALVLTICIGFCFLLGGILIQETVTQNACTALLEKNPVMVDAELLKLKKRQQGNLSIKLQFTTSSGQVMQGQRLTLKKYPTGEPDPTKFSIIYPEERPSCWVMSEEYGKNDINWAKRRYLAAFDLLVGLSFLIVGFIGVVVSVIRLRQTRPLANEVNAWLDIA